MEQYFGYIKDYFGQVTYDNILMKYMNASRTYLDSFNINEWQIYGSARIGVNHAYLNLVNHEFSGDTTGGGFTNTVNINYTYSQTSYSYFTLKRGNKHYELVNHLGNVLIVISDKKLQNCSGSTNSYYVADVMQATDYSAFGAPLASRSYTAPNTSYRFGFNGQEKDNEVSGDGNTMTAEFWEYDARLGRRWNVDPKFMNFPWQSPYAALDNNPVLKTDVKGDAASDGDGDPTKPTPPTSTSPTTTPKDNLGGSAQTPTPVSPNTPSASLPSLPSTPAPPSNTTNLPNQPNDQSIPFYKAQGAYLPVEGVGILGSFSINGVVNVSQDNNGQRQATVGVSGNLPSEKGDIGKVTFTGNAQVIVNGKVTSSSTFQGSSGATIYETGKSPVGTTTLQLPTSGNVQIQVNVGYEVKIPDLNHTIVTPSPSQTHIIINIPTLASP